MSKSAHKPLWPLFLSTAFIAFALVTGVELAQAQNKTNSPTSGQTPTTPEAITVVVEVQDLPGENNSRSFWEGVFEVRVADWDEVEDATKAGNTENVGVTLKRITAPRRSFISPEDRRVAVTIQVDGALKERFDSRPSVQTFLLRSTIRLFDANLDQNLPFKLNRVWRARLFPDGEAKISIKVLPDGSYNAFGPVPKNSSGAVTVVEVPNAKTKP